MLEYVTRKYGAERVAQIITFSTLSTKSALKDIGRALGIDHNEINELNKHIPVIQGKPIPVSEAMEEIPAIQQYQARYPRLFELALEVESMPRSQSVHACGVLITPEPITNDIALIKGKEGERVASYEGEPLEKLGFIKFDFLGLKNLSVVEICRRLVEKRHGHLIDVDNLIPEDEKTFEMIRRGETDGVFQIESAGMKKMFQGMNKVDFETLIAGVALYRPGPMDYIPKYQSLANGHEEIPSLHPKYDVITRTTFGIMIYQEQVMMVAQQMAGYSPGEADVLRKAVGKKKKEILEPALEELYNRLVEHGTSAQVANKICDDIRPFAGYAFNRSHAAAYAFIAYQTAYLKANYPLEYMTALLQVFYSKTDKVVQYSKVAREMGMEVLPPDINRSDVGFSIDGENTIRYGLGAIKGLGDATFDAIIEGRTTPYLSGQDLIDRVPKKNLNKGSLTALSYSGAFDSFIEGTFNNRFEYMAYLLDIRGDKPDAELVDLIAKYSDRSKFEKERDTLGSYVSGHILSRYAEPVNWDELDEAVTHTMVSLVEAKVIRTKKGQDMAFLKVDTLEGEKSLTLFPSFYGPVKEALVPGMILKVGVKGSMNWQRNQKDFIITSITAPKKINKEIWKKIEQKQEEAFVQGA
ncbi:DNA polymerase III subunit alpha [Cytobacillus oceanisediminis]|uniref:DNA polymerase III subunit alpha n=1 Tax=Cytobacillus oceanisediminis TaxID=665099 RepID=UPI001FB41E0D|nr:DNA polymerase III subunit alpha [Cytobacillus oceanisediminis]